MKHWSDCAVHNEPAFPKGECDCGGIPETKEEEVREKIAGFLAVRYYMYEWGKLPPYKKNAFLQDAKYILSLEE